MEKITKRKDGLYEIRVYLGTENKKPKYKSVYAKTQKEVKEKALQLKMSRANGMEVLSRNNNSFEFWANAWLRSAKAKAERRGNIDWYSITESRAKIWIDYFRGITIDKIRMSDCEEALEMFAKNNPYRPAYTSSAKTIKEYRSVLVRIFDYCIANRVLTFNPASETEIPQNLSKTEREPLTEDEVEYICDTPHEMQLAYMLMIYAGLRRGELLALNWKDIDFRKKTITINKSANTRQHNKIKEPKTEAGNRVVPIPDKLYEYLSNCEDNSLLVFNKNGKCYTERQFRSGVEKYNKEISIKYGVAFSTTAHCLRHTYCTILYEAGVDLETAKVLMGHSDIQTTLKIYTHLREKHKQNSIDKLNKYLAKI